MSAPTILAIFAHPDDESFGVGGTLTKYAHGGADVFLICATRGEAGIISDPSLATRDILPQVREGELREACAALGIREPIFLGYRDSGMVGTEDNHHPGCLAMAPPRKVVGELVRWIRLLRPQVVITWDPSGGYGHPDHVAVHRHATEAFARAGDGGSYPEHRREGLRPYAPRKLYYLAIPRGRAREMFAGMAKAGIAMPFEDMDFENFGTPDELVTTSIDVGPFVEAKIKAITSHRTQSTAGIPFEFLSSDVARGFLSTEHFWLSQSLVPTVDREDDLLRGLS